jgi:hypothetical protein
LINFLAFSDFDRIKVGDQAVPAFAVFDNHDVAIAADRPAKEIVPPAGATTRAACVTVSLMPRSRSH